MIRTIAAVGMLLLSVAACGSSQPLGSTVSPSVPTGGSLGSLGSPGCTPQASFHGWNAPDGSPEVGRDSSAGSLWALFFHAVPPPAGTEIKVVWRMTGSGDFVFRVTDEAGAAVPVAWGPELHGGSNWSHPGTEVGTGFNFPHAGCWNIHVSRSDSYGDLWLKVA